MRREAVGSCYLTDQSCPLPSTSALLSLLQLQSALFESPSFLSPGRGAHSLHPTRLLGNTPHMLALRLDGVGTCKVLTWALLQSPVWPWMNLVSVSGGCPVKMHSC